MKSLENLDPYDRNILRHLADQGRMSWRDLCDAIGLSLTPTLRRVRRLESAGYITGYSADLDERRLFGTISAFAAVSLERQSEDALGMFETRIGEIAEVRACSQVTGNTDYFLRIIARDLEHYQAIVARITQIPVVAQMHSNLILKTVEKSSANIL